MLFLGTTLSNIIYCLLTIYFCSDIYLPIPWGIYSPLYIYSYTSIGTTLIIINSNEKCDYIIVNQNTKICPLKNQTGKNNKQYYYVTLNLFLLTIIVTQNVMHTVYFIIINNHPV